MVAKNNSHEHLRATLSQPHSLSYAARFFGNQQTHGKITQCNLGNMTNFLMQRLCLNVRCDQHIDAHSIMQTNISNDNDLVRPGQGIEGMWWRRTWWLRRGGSGHHKWASSASESGSRCHTEPRCQCSMSHLCSQPADERTTSHCKAPQLCLKPATQH